MKSRMWGGQFAERPAVMEEIYASIDLIARTLRARSPKRCRPVARSDSERKGRFSAGERPYSSRASCPSSPRQPANVAPSRGPTRSRL
jgi:hypothetical protein